MDRYRAATILSLACVAPGRRGFLLRVYVRFRSLADIGLLRGHGCFTPVSRHLLNLGFHVR
jgi:hypothetical protein